MAQEPPRSPTPPAPVPPGGAAAAHAAASRTKADDTIVVYQHSTLFYWWPVWFFGFLFAAFTWFDGYHMAIVPPGTVATPKGAIVNGEERDAYVLDKNRKLLTKKDENDNEIPLQADLYVTRYRSLGTMFLFILLLVMFITNITLRGQWSLVVMIILVAVAVIFWLAGYWDYIFTHLTQLSIFLNMGAYMMIALVIFILWVLNVFFFDRQMYVVFTPGQVRVCQEIGMGETIYDAFQMSVQKQRSDLFRHIILGFGSGDLVLRFPRVPNPVELHNILNVTSVLKRVERLMQEKMVVDTPNNP